MEEKKHCKWYNDEFCTNDKSPCVADYCPVVEYPELCKFMEAEEKRWADEDIVNDIKSHIESMKGSGCNKTIVCMENIKRWFRLIKRLRGRNAELQNQVDELKKCGNGVLLTSLYKKQADDHKRGLSVQRAYWKKEVQKAHKDAAPLAIARFINQLHIDRIVMSDSDLGNELLKTKSFILQRYYGVEEE